MSVTGHTILYSPLLAQFDWLEHGFGTRHASIDQVLMARLKQIHSAECLLAERCGELGEADALIGNQPGITLSIRTADCVPILLADPVTRSVASIHAGWRGTAGRIANRGVRDLTERFSANPENVFAAIGPAIGECCYEVSRQVAEKLGVSLESEKGRVDLTAANRDQLIAAGLGAANIDIVGGCTRCNQDHFFSYRGEGERAGRMVSFIGVRRP